MKNKKKNIPGMGADAEVETNAQGGKQSKSPFTFYLMDPRVSLGLYENYQPVEPESNKYFESLLFCFEYMKYMDVKNLYNAMKKVEPDYFKTVETIAERLNYGATQGNNGRGYPINNWRLIPREQHLNHAMCHLWALIHGDDQDNHYGAALCRLHMALATEESAFFSYNAYIEPMKLEDCMIGMGVPKELIRTTAEVEAVVNANRAAANIPADFVSGEFSPDMQDIMKVAAASAEFVKDSIENTKE